MKEIDRCIEKQKKNKFLNWSPHTISMSEWWSFSYGRRISLRNVHPNNGIIITSLFLKDIDRCNFYELGVVFVVLTLVWKKSVHWMKKEDDNFQFLLHAFKNKSKRKKMKELKEGNIIIVNAMYTCSQERNRKVKSASASNNSSR